MQVYECNISPLVSRSEIHSLYSTPQKSRQSSNIEICSTSSTEQKSRTSTKSISLSDFVFETLSDTTNHYESVDHIFSKKENEIFEEISIQRKVIYQTSKALEMCKTSKFRDTIIELEAERILAIASE